MSRIVVLAILGIFAGVAFAQSTERCPSNIAVRGFRLGMSEAEVLRRHPKLELFVQKNDARTSTASAGISPALSDVFTETERKGLSRIDLTFYDKELSRIEIVYDGFTERASLSEFANAIAESLKLPSGKWTAVEKNGLKMSCSDVVVSLIFEAKRSKYEVQKQVLIVSKP